VYGLYSRERTWRLVALENQTIDPQAATASGIEVISESASSQREPADHEERGGSKQAMPSLCHQRYYEAAGISIRTCIRCWILLSW
jgi:hypothetical protein